MYYSLSHIGNVHGISLYIHCPVSQCIYNNSWGGVGEINGWGGGGGVATQIYQKKLQKTNQERQTVISSLWIANIFQLCWAFCNRI